MTDEQIKQNADAYANNYAVKSLYRPAYDGFVAGAHSRDEEVASLLSQLEDKDGYIAHLREELSKLRNPWISVEERLPAEFKPVIVMFESGIIINAFVTMVKDEPAWHPSVEIPIGSDVIFWMYIPQIEKEEVR